MSRRCSSHCQHLAIPLGIAQGIWSEAQDGRVPGIIPEGDLLQSALATGSSVGGPWEAVTWQACCLAGRSCGVEDVAGSAVVSCTCAWVLQCCMSSEPSQQGVPRFLVLAHRCLVGAAGVLILLLYVIHGA